MGFLGTLTSEPLSQLSPLKPETISSRMPLHRGAVADGRLRRHSQLTTACLAPGDVTREVAEFLAHVQPSTWTPGLTAASQAQKNQPTWPTSRPA